MLYNNVNFIVAVDNKFGIGKNNTIPWFIKEELKYFKDLTKDNVVIMGSKTFFSIPVEFRPLKNRLNIVLTNNKDLLNNKHKINNLIFTNLKPSNNILKFQERPNEIQNNKLKFIFTIIRNNNIFNKKDVFIIGGQKIYEMFLELFNNEIYYPDLQFNKIYLTLIEKDYKCDTFFPKLTENFKLIKYSKKSYSEEEDVHFRYLEYQKDIISLNGDENKYIKIASKILNNGRLRNDRTGVGIYSIFGTQTSFDISKYIPILTTKRVPFKTCVYELLWFLNGDTNNKNLQDKKVNIWNGNSSREYLDKIGLDNLEENDCGACYGFQWRHFGAEYIDCNTDYSGKGFDQVQYVLNLLKTDPFSRRIFLSAWNSADLLKTCLPPCHVSIQFYVEEIENIKYLSGHMYQRSADWFLGEPFNILSYSILIYLFAEICDMKPKELIISTGDTHIYSNHIEQMKEQIYRIPITKPKLWINPNIKNKDLKDISIDDFDLIGYFSYPTIKGKMAV
jgi:dihydrofolate reductase / thymidylate synthase